MASYGEKAVGLTFNPSGDKCVEVVKVRYAVLIDFLNAAREDAPADGEARRLYSIAIIQAQTAQMWAVKALTWKD